VRAAPLERQAGVDGLHPDLETRHHQGDDMVTTSPDLQRAVRALDAEFIRNANAGDAAALTRAYYTEDAVLLAPGAPRLNGTEAIRGFWQAFIDGGVQDVSIETTDLQEAGDLAYGLGTYTCTMPSSSGGRVRDTGKFIVVYRRQADGAWKVIADQFNSDLPAN
jgi:uncharacterized protein (TIGR02246 family)